MNKKLFLSTIAGLAVVFASATQSNAADILLFEAGLNIDGAIGNPPSHLPPAVDLSAWSDSTGLGEISVKLTGAGPHYAALFVDHEIDESDNTYFNEFGIPISGPAATQTWEIDEPGYVFGNIYGNFLAGTLDNSNGVPSGSPDDVSMALGWDMVLGAGETATVKYLVSESSPVGGFYLEQHDPDSLASIYFSSSIKITGGPSGVPEGGATATMLLLGLGSLVLAAKRKQVA